MSADVELSLVLRAIRDGDERDDLLDNRSLGVTLGWDLEHVAAVLRIAKDRLLIWGMPSAGKPGPWFTDLEVAVRGGRFLFASPAD